MGTTTHELERTHESLASIVSRQAYGSKHNSCPDYTCLLTVDLYRQKNDLTPVPQGHLAKLEGIAKKLGFPVEYVYEPIDGNVHTLGCTMVGYNWYGHLVKKIQILADMSQASKFRVLCHELGHAYLIYSGRERTDEQLQELIAESTAALVTGHLRVTDGTFSPVYLKAKCSWKDSTRMMRRVRPVAVEISQKILRRFE